MGWLRWVTGIAIAFACAAAEPPSTAAFLKRYCSGCHNAKLRTAGVSFDRPNRDTWEKAIRKLRTGEMPPPGLPQPKPELRDAVVRRLITRMDREAALRPDPGRVVLHRLNRTEYNNAVRDLLAVDYRPADDFPADDSGYGFDNIADVLSLPPVLMEKYLAAAGNVSRLALGRVRFDPVLERIPAPRDVPRNVRISEAAPAGSRGGIEFEHRFPADAEYLLRVRLRGPADPGASEIVDIFLDGVRLKRIEAKFTGEEENEEQRRLELRAPVNAGRRRVMVTFLRDDSKSENPNIEKGRRGRVGVDWVEIGGPFNVRGPGDTESRRRVLGCADRHNEGACASEILARLARRAWRRGVALDELERLMQFYRIGREDGFEAGIELGLKAILVSPHFLFRIERSVGELGGVELASRLSFFLWSSIPDETLLAAAERAELKTPVERAAHVRRMLADPRSRALTEGFAGQWLHLRNLAGHKPDPERFPGFDDGLRTAMQREAELLFESVVREDRSVLDFLDARDTFLDARLARHYGIAGIEGREFRRVELPVRARGGVLTMGAVLAVTSYPTRTSPVIRGKWVLENLLGSPPPPPPQDVPALPEASIGKTLSMRQQVEEHRKNPACAACHAKMDPIGFALENYDAVGRWRTHDGEFGIDASGKLPSGLAFANAAELKRALRERPEEFVLCFIEKLMTYALGRGVESADRPAIRRIAREAAKHNYRFSSIVLGIVESVPFRMRRATGGAHVSD